MLKMRLQRIGRKNDPSYRVVVTDSRRGPKSGKHVDLIGSFNPKLNQVQIDADKAKAWIANGVQVSDTMHNLLISQNIIEGNKKNVLPKKSPIVDEEKMKAEAEAKVAAEAAAAAPAEDVPVEAAADAEPAAVEEAPEEPAAVPDAEAIPAETEEPKEA